MFNESYPVLVQKKNNHYFVICNAFNIITESPDLLKAYSDMQELRLQLIERFEAVDFCIPKPPSNNGELSEYSVKSRQPLPMKNSIMLVVVLCFVGVALLGITGSIVTTFKKMNNKLTLLTQPSSWSVMLGTIADTLQAITPERKKEIRQNIGVIVREIEPFFDELRPLIDQELQIPERKTP